MLLANIQHYHRTGYRLASSFRITQYPEWHKGSNYSGRSPLIAFEDLRFACRIGCRSSFMFHGNSNLVSTSFVFAAEAVH